MREHRIKLPVPEHNVRTIFELITGWGCIESVDPVGFTMIVSFIQEGTLKELRRELLDRESELDCYEYNVDLWEAIKPPCVPLTRLGSGSVKGGSEGWVKVRTESLETLEKFVLNLYEEWDEEE